MTISEVSREYDISQDTLRYYERVGLIPHVNRTGSGIRDYDENDCRWVEFIKCMRRAGLPVETLIDYVSMVQQGDDTLAARREILLEERRKLGERVQEMQATYERLNSKIENYNQKCQAFEQKLR